jgi:hypothetical protein
MVAGGDYGLNVETAGSDAGGREKSENAKKYEVPSLSKWRGGTPYLRMNQKWDRNADWFKCGLVWEEAETGFGFEFGKNG